MPALRQSLLFNTRVWPLWFGTVLLCGCQSAASVATAPASPVATLEAVTPAPAEVAISTAIPPLLANLSQEFLLQPNAAVVAAPQQHSRKQKTVVEMELFEHVFAFSLPTKWQQTAMKARTGYRKFEYAPSAMSSQSSTVSVEAFQNKNQGYSAQRLLASYIKQATARCYHEVLFEPLGEKELDGYKTVEAIYGCTLGKKTKQQQSEVAYLLVVEADGNLYLFNKKQKVPSFARQHAPVSSATVERFLAPVLPLQLRAKQG